MPKTPLRASLIAICALAVVVFGWLRPSSEQLAVAENGQLGMLDTDGDLVPDSVEWLMQTDPSKVDTTGDGVDDFMAILSFQNTLKQAKSLPFEHGMRVLVTSAPNQARVVSAWLHIMVRFVGVQNANNIWVNPYIGVKGMKVSLIPALGYGNIRISSRRSGADTLFFISCELVEEDALARLLPCMIGADGYFDQQHINAGSYLIAAGEVPHALLPRGKDTFIAQPINTALRFQDSGGSLKGGRVCTMKLAVISSSRAGHLCEVVSAKCEAAAGLNCATAGPSACAKAVGQPYFVQGGLGTITGR